MTRTRLDLSAHTQEEAAAKLAEVLGALGPGEEAQFSTAADPRGVIRALMGAHWGHFGWAPLHEGAGEWLAVLTRRSAGPPISLAAMMEEDHRRCDALFAEAEEAARKGDAARTRVRFGWLDVGMEHHFRMEEEGFFAQVDAMVGMPGAGPVAVMRDEHQQMRGLLRRMAGAVEGERLEEFLSAADTMIYLMEQHNMKEEHMLYPMAEEAIAVAGEGMDEALKRIMLL